MRKTSRPLYERPVLDKGRASPIGTVTRRSRLVRTRFKGTRPLPFDLQVLPQRLKRTPVHPDCNTYAGSSAAAAAYLLRDKPLHQFAQMEGLDTTPKAWRIVLFGKVAYAESFKWAWAWKTAANIRGLPAEVERNDVQQIAAEATVHSEASAEAGEDAHAYAPADSQIG